MQFMMEVVQSCYHGETATGNYPVECVKVMSRVALATEKSINYWKGLDARNSDIDECDFKFIVNYAVCKTASNLKAKTIITYTKTGNTARALSSFGAQCPIFAITQDLVTYRQLGLIWNVIPKIFEEGRSKDQLLCEEINELKEQKYLGKGDIILVTGGSRAIDGINHEDAEINQNIGGVVKI